MSTLFHYTDEKGWSGIKTTLTILPSTAVKNPRDARHGDGQYLTDIEPGTMSGARLSRALIGHPFMGSRFSHFVEIETGGLAVRNPRHHVFVIPNETALDISDRLVRHGEV